MNCFTCPSDQGYDALINMTEAIENLATDDDTLKLMEVMQDNKDEKLIKTFGIIMAKIRPYMRKHKKDIFSLLSNFFVRSEEETKKKSIFELKDEMMEVFNHPMVKELFTSAQTRTLEGMFGSAQENTEDTAQEASSDILKLV